MGHFFDFMFMVFFINNILILCFLEFFPNSPEILCLMIFWSASILNIMFCARNGIMEWGKKFLGVFKLRNSVL